MMDCDYPYRTQDASHSHTYLTATVLDILAAGPEPARLLDAGCGNGSFTAVLVEAGYAAEGCDCSESGIAFARRAHPEIPFRRASLYDDLRSETSPEGFDAIVAIEVIEHLMRPRDFVGRAFAALRPGGRLILTTPYHGYAKNLALSISGRLDNHFTALWDGGHIKFWSRNTLSALLREAGFAIGEFRGAGRVPYLWKSMIMTAART